MPWSTPFDDPIPLPDGRNLISLKDAAAYVQKLPKSQHDLPHWQTAVETLLLCSRGGDPMMARIAMLMALNHGTPAPAKAPRRKRVKPVTIVR